MVETGGIEITGELETETGTNTGRGTETVDGPITDADEE